MKIAILSDSPTIPTGYRNQATQLAKYLQKQGHEIHYFANAYHGSDVEGLKLAGGEEFNYKIYGHDMNDAYFHKTLPTKLKQIQADRLIILLDTFMLMQVNFLAWDTSPAKTFFWFPSDGGSFPKGCETILQKIDCPVAMARYGQKQMKDLYRMSVEHIPHGLDAKDFRPLPKEEKDALRKQMGLDGKFVIGVVARNQPRKFLDRTIKIMSIFKDKAPNAVLFLHMDPDDAAQACDLRSLIKKYNLENRVVFSGMNAFKGIPQNEMHKLYNVMDCFLLSTSGEGFGVPIIEAMACEVPVVATSYTTTPELVEENKCGLGIELSGVPHLNMFDHNMMEYDKLVMNGTMLGSWEVERGICSIYHGAECLEKLYNDPELCKEMGKNGRKAVEEKYDFEVVGKQWAELLK